MTVKQGTSDRLPTRRSGRLLTAAFLLLGVVAAVVAFRGVNRDPQPIAQPDNSAPADGRDLEPEAAEPSAPFVVGRRENYVTSAACQKCHAEQYKSWHHSYHRTMTQFATPETILAPLDDTTLESRGRTYRFQRRGDKFMVTLASQEWEMEQLKQGADLSTLRNVPLTTREIVMTTGSHNMQTYWIRAEDGFRQVPWYWHISEKLWVPAEDSFLQPATMQRNFTRWNSVCIKCHTSGDNPGLHPRTGYNTTVAELGIACEACHGQGQQHVEWHERHPAAERAGEVTGPQQQRDDSICNPAAMSHTAASQICAQCHSSARPRDLNGWLAKGSTYKPGEPLTTFFHLVRYNKQLPEDQNYLQNDYWADGTCRTAGDEFQGLMESACHVRGEMSCLSCHSLHQYADRSDQLKRSMEGNEACLQCHEPYRSQLTEHTHHAADSAGSLCYNCHMPHITFGLLKGIRSHRIDSPSAAITASTGRPNACNLCHLDQTLEWTADKLTQWYQQPPVELNDDDRQVAASVRGLLAGDAVQRAIAAWHMGWPEAQAASGRDWQAPYLAHVLDDPYSVVRFVGRRSLRSLPGFQDFEYNFISPPEGRKQAVDSVLTLWQKQHPQLPPREAILLNSDGKLRMDEIRRLRAGRDNRPVMIHE